MPAIIHSVEELRGILDTWRSAGETVALVPTMGSLHEGHKALVREAATHADRCVVSIFVNPLQFGAGEDFEAYPRSLVADEEFLADTLVDLIFAPSAEVIYPEGPEEAPTLSAGGVGDAFEGASRPGHFDGVLTVVKRLFDYVSPDVAVFGLKDAQQVFVVRQMVDTLGLPLRVVEVDTVRDTDGLALSSRNAHLSDTERVYAREISRALDEAENTSSAREALEVARGILDAAPGVVVDYVDVVDPQTFRSRADGGEGLDGRLIIAATVGGVRLIDNRLLRFGQ
jgi:pantoate--beta-alanine ligase